MSDDVDGETAPADDGEGPSIATILLVILVTLAGFVLGAVIASSDALESGPTDRPDLVEDGMDPATGPNDGAPGGSTADETDDSDGGDENDEGDASDDPQFESIRVDGPSSAS